MAINPTSAPGLYIVELPSNAHTIQAAPKSIAVFVGYTHPFKTKRFDHAIEVDSFTDYERQFGGLYASGIIDAHVAYAINQFFLNGGIKSWVIGLEPKYYDNTNNSLGKVKDSAPTTTIGQIIFTGREMTDLVPMRVTIDNVVAGKADITITYGSSIETYRKVSLVSTDATYIEKVIGTQTKPASGLVTVKPNGANYGAFAAASNQALTITPPLTWATTFSASDFNGVFQADSSLDKDVDIFNLLLVPGVTDFGVCSDALAFAERKKAFVILDPPVQAASDDSGGLTPMQDLVDANLVPKSTNGAIYFPYLRTIDPVTASPIELPPSGFVAGKIAETDQVGPWIAPAGLGTIIGTTTGVVTRGKLTDARLGNLNFRGVNCLRSLPGIGTVIWGARTLVAENTAFEQWKYVPIRRMALFIEQSLLMSLTWAVFQPNDDPLYLALRNTVGNFMLSLFNAGAFEGSTPSQAFRVVCDRTTTTDDDRAGGVCNILVAFRPLKPAEFVVIKIAQLAGQAAA
jgi:phage tail sheath protein FI